MAYLPHYLLAWGGPYWGTEEWTNTLRFGRSDGTINEDVAEPLLETLAEVVRDYVQSSSYSSRASFAWLKVNAIQANGRYAYPTTNQWEEPTPIVSGTGSAGYPQIATAISTRTDFSRGFAAKGRYFLPLSPEIGSNGRMTATYAGQLAGDASTFLEQINAVLDPGGTGATGLALRVYSAYDAQAHLITSVRVGDVADTQRRRRNQLPELYVASSVDA